MAPTWLVRNYNLYIYNLIGQRTDVIPAYILLLINCVIIINEAVRLEAFAWASITSVSA